MNVPRALCRPYAREHFDRSPDTDFFSSRGCRAREWGTQSGTVHRVPNFLRLHHGDPRQGPVGRRRQIRINPRRYIVEMPVVPSKVAGVSGVPATSGNDGNRGNGKFAIPSLGLHGMMPRAGWAMTRALSGRERSMTQQNLWRSHAPWHQTAANVPCHRTQTLFSLLPARAEAACPPGIGERGGCIRCRWNGADLLPGREWGMADRNR